MSIKTPAKKPSNIKTTSKKSYLLAFAVASSTLLTGLGATTMSTQAASLGDLFSSDQSAAQKKFLPVEQAFQVSTSTKAVDKGTRLAINFDITPEHYVYRDQIKRTLPAGVSAAPFTFSQTPVAIDDPIFGKVQVFDQANMVATTTLSSSSSVDKGAITVAWQGCAKAGLCYPPEKIKTTVNIAAIPTAASATVATAEVTADGASTTTPPSTSIIAIV